MALQQGLLGTGSKGSSMASGVDEGHPACQSCRQRKLKCSREIPLCSQCSRLNTACVYSSRQKPGMKSGAVEALSRRVEALEEELHHRRNGGDHQSAPQHHDAQQSLCDVSMLLVKELERIRQNPYPNSESGPGALSDSRKRRKCTVDPDLDYNSSLFDDLDEDTLFSVLPSPSVLDAVIDTFFLKFQPWIPFLHEPRFRHNITIPQRKTQLSVLLHAMVCATLRFLRRDNSRLEDDQEIEKQVRRSRQVVMLRAMECPSIVHLQALTIIVFDHLGSGHFEKAWSLVGSLTRTVEYLQLTVEPDEQLLQRPFHKPLSLLDEACSWTEVEGRRRLFWNIFLLDRLCSVTTGWSTSLTSDDVHRKLPCDGGMWMREESCDTPYFGIWNKSAAKIGNSIAYIPAHYPTPDQEESVRSPGTVPTAVDMSKLGAFAYCIEATESLSQVTTFFLQQRVDFRNRQEVGSWLTRFKELDLRLVHWKMFLPQQWKDSNISRDATLIDMDPNLTLAHITHNTSMILLHQHIAFPPPNWAGIVKLPSICSAETCFTAAVETVAITKKYLKYKPVDIVNTQFAMCAFVAGRILLVHSHVSSTELASEYFDIVDCLKQMGARWEGSATADKDFSSHSTLPGKYALKLEYIHKKLSEKPQMYLEVMGYSKSRSSSGLDGLLLPVGVLTDSSAFETHNTGDTYSTNQLNSPSFTNGHRRQPSNASAHLSLAGLSPDPGRTMSAAALPEGRWQSMAAPNRTSPEFAALGRTQSSTEIVQSYNHVPVDDELTAMSNLLFGQQFLEMDRVITFDGTDFALDMSQWQNMS